MFGPTPILIVSQNTKRDSGRKVHIENISAAKTVADVIRTCLGPQAMLKMLMDPMGGIVMTNDGNAILREIQVSHPAAKSLIEIARTQDEEVGDGTTSVIVLTGEIMAVAEPFLAQHMHPTVLIRAYRQALEDIIPVLEDKISIKIDTKDEEKLIAVVKACIGTKFIGRWSDLACKIALDAVRTVKVDEDDRCEIDIKNYARIEKIPGGSLEDSTVLDGVMINKDVTHPGMRRYIENPRILLLDCNLEYKKAESQTNIEMMQEGDFTRLLELEEQYIKDICTKIISVKPDIVFTEKGISDLAQHYLVGANITALRRLRKTDNNRIAKACGATIVNRPDEIKEEDIGTNAGLFEVKKIGDEYFSYITKCKNPKACTILLRGASKDILNEAERNLQDALHVAKNIMINPKLVPGGGAVEMAVSKALMENSNAITGVEKGPYKAVAQALEIIPRTLAQNCGANIIRTLTALRADHASGKSTIGIDGTSGKLVDIMQLGILEPLSVKMQVYKTAIETSIMLLRIDDIVSGTKKKQDSSNPGAQDAQPTPQSMQE